MSRRQSPTRSSKSCVAGGTRSPGCARIASRGARPRCSSIRRPETGSLASTSLQGHDIPNDVIVQAFLKPEGNRARVLLRVPMKGMPDVEVPLRDRGYLNIPVADEALKGAALVWLARNVRLYED